MPSFGLLSNELRNNLWLKRETLKLALTLSRTGTRATSHAHANGSEDGAHNAIVPLPCAPRQ